MELDFISVKVSDLESSIQFYNQLLQARPESVNDRLAIYNFEGVRFALYYPPADGLDGEIRPGNSCTPAFRVDNLEEERQRVEAFTEAFGGYELEDHAGFFVKDPDGNAVEFYEWFG